MTSWLGPLGPGFFRMRIPLKWGTDSGEVGQRRSEATLVRDIIAEVPHLSQESAAFRFIYHHFVSRFAKASGLGIPLTGARFR